MYIVIKKEVHTPVELIKERTYKVDRISKELSIRRNRIFRKVYHTRIPIYRWREEDIEEVIE